MSKIKHSIRKSQPNIIFFLIDDMGWKDLSCMGSVFYETPNIDRLGKNGKVFSKGYVASPVCSPTRASFMTGKYPASTGITDWINHERISNSFYGHSKGYLIDAPYLDHLPLEEKSIASSLKEGGYQTWHVGKWHLGKSPWYPENHGFDVNVGGCYIGSPQNSGYFSPWTDIEALKNLDVPDGTYLTDYLTDKAIELINERDINMPFYLNMWYYSVHTPIEAKQEKIEKYKKKAKNMGLDKLETFQQGDFFPFESNKNQRIKRRLLQSDPVYAAMIESLDENIGRLLDLLEEKGLDKDTLIVFTSDNGGLATAEGSPTCNLPLAEGKGWMYEGGVRVPWIITWPGKVGANTKSDIPITSTDVYPTFLEAAGLPLIPEQHKDGVSMIPELLDTGLVERDAIYWHYPHYGNQGGTPGSSILVYPWKLIKFYEDDRLELYNLAKDPGELLNIIDDYTEKAAILAKKLNDWLKKNVVHYPTRNKQFMPWSFDHKTRGFQPWD